VFVVRHRSLELLSTYRDLRISKHTHNAQQCKSKSTHSVQTSAKAAVTLTAMQRESNHHQILISSG